MFGTSIEAKRVYELAVASDAQVLITGPTGVGKSTLALDIHRRGSRSQRPFVTVNLATVHEGTLESELFGHERGAFTGAETRRIGRLETAQGGTVFLDEIGELSPRLQARLLEFLQSRTIVPVGGNRPVRLDVRVMVATHRDLVAMVKVGTFREDLFHRLRILTLSLPSLADRGEEFDELLHSVLERVCSERGKPVLRVAESAADVLEKHDWPGNLRELSNVLEYAVIACRGAEITASDLPPWFHEALREHESIADTPSGPLLAVAQVPLTLDYHETLSRFERQYLSCALQRFRGRVNQTARKIGMNKTTLIRRIRLYGIGIKEKNEVTEDVEIAFD